jgi:hypothetical protein
VTHRGTPKDMGILRAPAFGEIGQTKLTTTVTPRRSGLVQRNTPKRTSRFFMDINFIKRYNPNNPRRGSLASRASEAYPDRAAIRLERRPYHGYRRTRVGTQEPAEPDAVYALSPRA